MHQELAGAKPARVDLEVGDVLAQRGDEGVGHPLALHPQRVDDVGLLEAIEAVRDLQFIACSIPRGISVGGPASVT